MSDPCVLISADHGMALVYFLQSDVVNILLKNRVSIVILTDDEIKDQIAAKFAQPGLVFEGLQLKLLKKYFETVDPRWQWVLAYLRRVGGSTRINTEAMDSHRKEVWAENSWKFRLGIWLPCEIAAFFLKHSRWARKLLVRLQGKYTTSVYTELFERYKPDLVITSTPGWRMDRYLLREANRENIPAMSVVVGWDNPSSYSIPGAKVDWITCWSELQRQELVEGSDWDPAKVHVGGIPSYDGYFRKDWVISKDEYFRMHQLDPKRKLISYACSFVHFSPNYPNIEALVELISKDDLCEPAQLLIRLHPSHFQDKPRIFAEEREKIFALEQKYPNIYVVHPVPLGGSLGYYSGEDMPEKTSMMVYSDVFTTVYSTMLVECAIQNTPIVSICIDVPGGWNKPGKFSLALREIGNWPTHQRFRELRAGRIASDRGELKNQFNLYLRDHLIDEDERLKFVQQEVTYLDASSGVRTAKYIQQVLDNITLSNSKESI